MMMITRLLFEQASTLIAITLKDKPAIMHAVLYDSMRLSSKVAPRAHLMIP